MAGPGVEVVEADVTADDVAAFFRWIGQREHGRRRILVLVAAMLFLPVLVLGGFFFDTGVSRMVFYDVLRPLLVVFYAVLIVYLLVIWSMPRLAAKQLEKQPGAIGRRRYEAGDDAFRSQNEVIDVQVRWSGVTGVEETPEHIFVLTGPHAAFVVPRRAFADDAARARFVAAVGGHLRRVSGSASSR
jgi:hypothetical protein